MSGHANWIDGLSPVFVFIWGGKELSDVWSIKMFHFEMIKLIDRVVELKRLWGVIEYYATNQTAAKGDALQFRRRRCRYSIFFISLFILSATGAQKSNSGDIFFFTGVLFIIYYQVILQWKELFSIRQLKNSSVNISPTEMNEESFSFSFLNYYSKIYLLVISRFAIYCYVFVWFHG